jgi:hypothetical protein
MKSIVRADGALISREEGADQALSVLVEGLGI